MEGETGSDPCPQAGGRERGEGPLPASPPGAGVPRPCWRKVVGGHLWEVGMASRMGNGGQEDPTYDVPCLTLSPTMSRTRTQRQEEIKWPELSAMIGGIGI